MIEEEGKSDWYLRQMLGTANFDAGPLMAFASGNLCYQIEHHLFPDLPSNRYAEIAVQVRAVCEKFDIPYTTGSLLAQYWQTLRTIHVLALPDRFSHPLAGRQECLRGAVGAIEKAETEAGWHGLLAWFEQFPAGRAPTSHLRMRRILIVGTRRAMLLAGMSRSWRTC